MARDEVYYEVARHIEAARLARTPKLIFASRRITELPESIGQLTDLQSLDLSANRLTALPESIGQLTQLQSLDLSRNQLTALPDSIGQLNNLQTLHLSSNELTSIPTTVGLLHKLQDLKLYNNRLIGIPPALYELENLQILWIGMNPLKSLTEISSLKFLTELELRELEFDSLPPEISQLSSLKSLIIGTERIKLGGLTVGENRIASLPTEIGQLNQLQWLTLSNCKIVDLPSSMVRLENLMMIDLDGNPLNPELAAAYEQGFDAIMAYLRAKAAAQITLHEAKLILVGEGEVGKTCLMDALEGKPWEEHPSTHGIEIRPVEMKDPESETSITINGWDFGGQRVYRPTHQLFFSSPAVYLVVWKPREGPQQGFVKEWITLIKHREPDAKILVVATHGGPQQRQPDIDRQEIWDIFGNETVIDFFHVDSHPDENGFRRGIEELKQAIARVAASLPEVGREVPQRWEAARRALKVEGTAYLPRERVFEICDDHEMARDEARLFITIMHRLGHLIHYEHDPTLRDIVVLKPDWLATAISFVLDDEVTRANQGLAPFTRLRQLWDNPIRDHEDRYPADLHPIFLRLMERFDLSYRVVGSPLQDQDGETSLIAQLVPDTRPEDALTSAWPRAISTGDIQQVQICRIVDEKGQSATAEGLFYQLIVRLHKYSLGRKDYCLSVHWQRGLVLDNDYNGRALLEHEGNDVRITVRAPYPERFLAMLTSEVKYLVESFWEGLRCDVMVPCIDPCGVDTPGHGNFEVEKLIAFRRQGMTIFPCMVSGCNQIQNIDALLRNAPIARRLNDSEIRGDLEVMRDTRNQLAMPGPHVFLSYVSEDLDAAKRIFEELSSRV